LLSKFRRDRSHETDRLNLSIQTFNLIEENQPLRPSTLQTSSATFRNAIDLNLPQVTHANYTQNNQPRHTDSS
jgi:hypothetical protein